MLFDFQSMASMDVYKIIASSVVPRPIAWITTKSKAGILNAAPFSFFNAMGSDPPTVAIGLMHREGQLKDTAANIMETGEFVVNLVSEATAEAMNVTCIDAPSEVNELQLAKLTAVPSHSVAPPRIGESPVAFECRTLSTLHPGPTSTIVIGQALCAHVADAFVLDAKRCYLDTPALQLVARMHGRGVYVRSTDRFEMDRPVWAEWRKREEE